MFKLMLMVMTMLVMKLKFWFWSFSIPLIIKQTCQPGGAPHMPGNLFICLCVHVYPITYTGWWFEPLWKILVSWDDYSQLNGTIKFMLQTTNQIIKIITIWYDIHSLPWKDPPILYLGKPSISMGHLYHYHIPYAPWCWNIYQHLP